MARTDAGAALTAQHRQSQLRLRALTLQQMMSLWPLWQAARAESFGTFVEATVPLVELRRRDSAALGAAYYQAFRLAEGVGGNPATRLMAEVETDKVVTSLYVTGDQAVKRGLAAGFSPQAAQQAALAAVSGAATRHVLDGGRDTVIASTDADRTATGWQRVAGGSACAWCAMLASRGPVYTSERNAMAIDRKKPEIGRSHDHCSCSIESVYGRSKLPDTSQRYRDLWNEVTPGYSGKDALNAFRRALSA